MSEVDSLLDVLDRTPAREFDLYVENALVPLLSALAPYSLLKQHGVRSLIPLSTTAVQAAPPHNSAVFMTTADPQSLAIASVLISKLSSGPHSIILVPEAPHSVELLLAEYGVLGDVKISTFGGILAKDSAVPGILSCYSPAQADAATDLFHLAWALDNLQFTSTGLFGKVTAVGPQGRQVLHLLETMRSERAVKMQNLSTEKNEFEYHFGYTSDVFSGEEVEHAIIIDRNLDLVTPMLMQTTYAGVLTETLGISPSGICGGKLVGADRAQLRGDGFFGRIANTSFSEACDSVYDAAKQLQQDFETDANAIDKSSTSVAEFRKVVQKLGSLETTKRLVQLHTELATSAMAELERSFYQEVYDLQNQMIDNRIANTQAIARIQDLIFQSQPLPWVFRLISLLALLRDGIKEQVLKNLFNGDICRTYGFENIENIERLYSRGLIFSPRGSSFLLSTPSFAPSLTSFVSSSTTSSESASSSNRSNALSGVSGDIGPIRSATGSAGASLGPQFELPLPQQYTWYTLNKAYNLYPSGKVTEGVPYAGYVPLTARIAQLAIGSIPLAKTPLEPEFETLVNTSADRDAWRESKLRRTLIHNTLGHGKPVLLVVVVGGVTYAEAEAIRLAVQASKRERRVIIVSNSIITGEDLVK